MRIVRNVRWLLLALLLSVVPASSYAGVFISVGFAPPVLPVYVQPVCPGPGLMWTPGYWAYGDDGYFWVPGAWVPAPYEGALWTPPYWGWSGGLYVFYPGYWGRHVGYYGGVNYGFGYMGVGFVGGMWRGHEFAYNTAVMHVNERFVHTTYMDRTIVERNTIHNDRHVAFSGGPGGIRHDPAPEERFAEHDQHMDRTSFQTQHEVAARSDHGSYFKSNGGHPNTMALPRPLGSDMHGSPAGRQGFQNQQRPMDQQRTMQQNHPMNQQRSIQQSRPMDQQRSVQQPRQMEQQRPMPQQRPQPQQPHQMEQPRPQPQQRSAPQSRPAPEQHSAPRSEPREKEHR